MTKPFATESFEARETPLAVSQRAGARAEGRLGWVDRSRCAGDGGTVRVFDAGVNGPRRWGGCASGSATRMDTLFEIDDRNVLYGWAKARGRRRSGAQQQSGMAITGLRFAFYGRTSTAEFQDPVTSRAWQREMAESVIVGHGMIAGGVLRRRVFTSGAVGAAAAGGGAAGAGARARMRSFDAVVVGEFERAFTDRQFDMRSPRCWRVHGVAVWLPEAGGPVRSRRSGPSGVDAGAGRAVAAGGGAVAAPDPGGDDRPDGRAGPVPRRSAAVWVSAGGRGAASEPGARGMGTASAAAGSGSGDRAPCAVDVRRAARRAQCCRDRSRVERARCAVPVGCGSRSGTPTAAGRRGTCGRWR